MATAHTQSVCRRTAVFVGPDAGQTVEVPVYASTDENITGYQFTMEFDPQSYEFVDVASGKMQVTDANFGFMQIENGLITTSWNNETPVFVDTHTPLFTLKFIARQDINNSKAIEITSEITPAMAIDGDYNASRVVLALRSGQDARFELMQNNPNPFNEVTSISFVLPEKADATITISDVTGKTVKTINGHFQAGLNSVLIQKSDINATGVLMYRIESGVHSQTKKMIVLE